MCSISLKNRTIWNIKNVEEIPTKGPRQRKGSKRRKKQPPLRQNFSVPLNDAGKENI
jgi:hypothetical protein